MKSVLIACVLALTPVLASASEGEGGVGLPASYYNPDAKCSMGSGLVLYVNAAPTLRLQASYFDSHRNKIVNSELALVDSFQKGQFQVYRIAQTLVGSNVGFLQTDGQSYMILNTEGEVSATCEAFVPGNAGGNFP